MNFTSQRLLGRAPRHTEAVLVAVLGAMLIAGCQRSWQHDAQQRLNSGRPADALEVLQRVQPEDRSILWYVFVTSANTALFKSSGEQRFRVAALDSVDKGMVRFPNSARLRLEKAFSLYNFGEASKAKECLADAVETAERHLRGHLPVEEAEMDRGVLRQAKVLEVELSRQQ